MLLRMRTRRAAADGTGLPKRAAPGAAALPPLPGKGWGLHLSSQAATWKIHSSWCSQADITASGHVFPKGEDGEENLCLAVFWHSS